MTPHRTYVMLLPPGPQVTPVQGVGVHGSTLALVWLAQPVTALQPEPLVARYRFTKPCRSPALTRAATPVSLTRRIPLAGATGSAASLSENERMMPASASEKVGVTVDMDGSLSWIVPDSELFDHGMHTVLSTWTRSSESRLPLPVAVVPSAGPARGGWKDTASMSASTSRTSRALAAPGRASDGRRSRWSRWPGVRRKRHSASG